MNKRKFFRLFKFNDELKKYNLVYSGKASFYFVFIYKVTQKFV